MPSNLVQTLRSACAILLGSLGPLCTVASAQSELQPSGVRLTPGGAVAWTWDQLHVGRDPGRLQRVEAAAVRGILDVQATARWIAVRHTEGVTLFAWGDRSRVVSSIEAQVSVLASDGTRLLALGADGRAWQVDEQGAWVEGATDLAPGAPAQLVHLGSRWVLAHDELEDPQPSVEASGATSGEGDSDGDGGGDGGGDEGTGATDDESAYDDESYGFGGVGEQPRFGALWHSTDGLHWTRAALPARVGREPVGALACGARGGLAVFSDGAVIGTEDGLTWRDAVAPPLRWLGSPPPVFVDAHGFHVFDHLSPEPTLLHSSVDLVTWTSASLPPLRLVHECVAIGERSVWVGRAVLGLALDVHPFESLTEPWQPDLGPYPLPTGATLDLLRVTKPLTSARAFADTVYVLARDGYVHTLGPEGALGVGTGSASQGGHADDFLVLPDKTIVVGSGRVFVHEASGGSYSYQTLEGARAARRLFHVGGRFSALDLSDGFSLNDLPWLASGMVATYPARAEWRAAAPTPDRWVLVGRAVDGGAAVASGNVTIDAARLPPVRGAALAVASTWRDPLPAVDNPRAAPFGVMCVGSQGLVLVSSDGVTWRGGNLEGDPELVAVAHGAGQWGALAADGRLYVSEDGLEWRVAFASADAPLTQLVGTSDALVALSGRLARLTWQAAPSALDSRPPLRVIEAQVVDRTEQVERLVLVTPDEVLHGIAHDGARYVAAGAAGILESDDGRRFERAPIAGQFVHGYGGLAQFGGRTWLWHGAAGDESRVQARLPGAPIEQPRGFGLARIDALAGDDTRAAATGVGELHRELQPARLFTSVDGGHSWGPAHPPVFSRARGTLVFGAGAFVTTGHIEARTSSPVVAALSRDLVHWEVHPLPTAIDAPLDIEHTNGHFVALAPPRGTRGARLAVSRDGVEWRGLAWSAFRAERLFVGAGRFWAHDGRTLITSTDGYAWVRAAAVEGAPAEWLYERAGVLFLGWTRDRDGRAESRFARLPRPSEVMLREAEYEPSALLPSFRAALASLGPMLRRVPYPLARARAVDELLREHPTLQVSDNEALADVILGVDRSVALSYVLAIATNDGLAAALRARSTEAERAALTQFARERVAEAPVPTETPAHAPKVDVPSDGGRVRGDLHVSTVVARYEATRNPAFAYDLAIVYDQGLGVAADSLRARELAAVVRAARLLDEGETRAASEGSVYAALNMVVASRERSDAVAERAWMRVAARNGSYSAREAVAQQVLMHGDLRLATPKEAFEWLVSNARAGHGESMNLLAIAIRHGIGVEPDETLARAWFGAGARFGSESASNNLAAIEQHERELRAMMDLYLEQAAVEAEIWSGVEDAFAEYAEQLQRLGLGEPDKAPK